MPANTSGGFPYPLGTDRLMDGDNAIQSLAQKVDDFFNTRCKAYRNAAGPTIPDSTYTAVLLDADDIDPTDLHNPAANPSRITIKTPGRYLAIGNLQFPGGGANSGFRRAALYRNGVAVAYTMVNAPSTNVTIFLNLSATAYMAAGDYWELMAYQTSGVALAYNPGINNTWLDVVLCGSA